MTLRLCGMYERGMLGNSVEGCATSVDSGRWEAKDDGHEEMQYVGRELVANEEREERKVMELWDHMGVCTYVYLDVVGISYYACRSISIVAYTAFISHLPRKTLSVCSVLLIPRSYSRPRPRPRPSLSAKNLTCRLISSSPRMRNCFSPSKISFRARRST